MARYDEARGEGAGGPRPERGSGWQEQESWGTRVGGGMSRHPGWSGRTMRGGDLMFGEAVYGPERYGLGPYHERLRRRRRPDDELKHEVEEALFFDTWVDADAITVAIRDGVVTLTGTLPSYDEVRYATDDAWDIEGVLGVHSELAVDQ